MEQPLRQPRTFWQWLTHQEGTLFVPTKPKATAALAVIERELIRLHDELESIMSDTGPGYGKLIAAIDKLNEELIRRSKEESADETVSTRQGKRNEVGRKGRRLPSDTRLV